MAICVDILRGTATKRELFRKIACLLRQDMSTNYGKPSDIARFYEFMRDVTIYPMVSILI